MVRLRMLTLLGLGAVLLGLLVSPGMAAPGDNAENAARCEAGGYLAYTREDGTPFKNAGQCTSYAARGGTLTPVVPTAVLDFVAYAVRQCSARLTVTGYAAGTYAVTFAGFGSYSLVVGADGTGVVTSLLAFGAGYRNIAAAVDGVVVDSATAAC